MKWTQRIRIRKNGETLFRDIEVASSYRERMKGLSGRKELGCGGLLFVFTREAKHSIWMPNMKFPIDIVFIDKERKVVDIKCCARPISANPKTWRIFRPKEKALYVLELPANHTKTLLKEGDALVFDIPNTK